MKEQKTDLGKTFNIFYDGECGFCNFWVSFLSRLDSSKKYHYYSLSSEYAVQQLVHPLPATRSVIYQKGDHLYTKSEAVIQILRGLGGKYKLAVLLYIIPHRLRDWTYDKVARNRHKLPWFENSSCTRGNSKFS
ncbi:MAG: DCC1-like thiol-disulfide oxidoreductase family protein [Leptospirales bacterium]